MLKKRNKPEQNKRLACLVLQPVKQTENSLLSSDKEGQEYPNLSPAMKGLYPEPVLLPPFHNPSHSFVAYLFSYVLGNKSFMECDLSKGRNLSGIMVGGQVMCKRGEKVTIFSHEQTLFHLPLFTCFF